MINVTKTYLPPLEEYVEQLKKIWASGQVTNNGPLLKELEQKLKEYLGVKHLFVVANGTVGLQIAIKALGIRRKIITTPFSYVASTGAILWENCEPVFVDINAGDFCIDPALIEAAITPDVEAILAVHVYGNPCNVSAIEAIARKHRLRVIYDAAHAFGSSLLGRSIASFGDVSCMSFHATKLFHAVEGGALVTDDDELARKIRLFRAFGHIGDDYFSIGINGKNSEFHAAMGLCILPRVADFIAQRQVLTERYDRLIKKVPLIRPRSTMADLKYNYAYYPVVFPSEEVLLQAKVALESHNFIPRRYFYPSLNRLPYFKGQSCPIAESVAERVLCLPLSHQVTPEIQESITSILTEYLDA